MLNRRQIRIKVMQVLYGIQGSESQNILKERKFLQKSFDDFSELHLTTLSLFIELRKRASNVIDQSKKKILASQEDINPNQKFINNRVLLAIFNSNEINQELEDRKIKPWYLNFEYIEILFREITESDLYKEYMKSEVSSLKEDKEFIVKIFKRIIAENDKIYDFYEDYKLTWLDDLPLVNTGIVKLIKKFEDDSSSKHFLPQLFKDQDDKEFGFNLLDKTFLNTSKFNLEFQDKTKNWDKDRIAVLDAVILRLAICEFNRFPSIPVKVTINEYLEIAKEYSTPKSSVFINGVLDKILKEYADKGSLNKVGRGLF